MHQTQRLALQVPNGELTSEQSRFLGQCVRKYGEKGCLDITTRANIQLRGVTLDDADHIFDGLQEVGLTCVQTGKTASHHWSMCATHRMFLWGVVW